MIVSVLGSFSRIRQTLANRNVLVALAGDFILWVASPEAAFLRGKFVWSNWNVEEMKERADEI